MDQHDGQTGRLHYSGDRQYFELDFCTVARWQDGQIAGGHLFYDRVGLMRQIGVSR